MDGHRLASSTKRRAPPSPSRKSGSISRSDFSPFFRRSRTRWAGDHTGRDLIESTRRSELYPRHERGDRPEGGRPLPAAAGFEMARLHAFEDLSQPTRMATRRAHSLHRWRGREPPPYEPDVQSRGGSMRQPPTRRPTRRMSVRQAARATARSWLPTTPTAGTERTLLTTSIVAVSNARMTKV